MADSSSGLKILFIGVAWPPEIFIAGLVMGLLAAGVRVTVASSRRPDSVWMARPGFSWLSVASWEDFPPLRLLHFGVRLLRAFLFFHPDLERFSASINSLREKPYLSVWNRLLPFTGRRWDLIYFPWNLAAIDHLPLFDLGMPVVVSCRGAQVNIAPHNPQRAGIRAGLRTTFEKAAAVHCVSEAIAGEAKAFGLDPSKVTVIRPAVDPDFFCPLPDREPKEPADAFFLVISTGSIIWRKGYEYALSAIRLLKDRGVPVRYHIIGDGPERSRLLYTIQDLGLQDEVTLLGRRSPGQVRDELQRADAFLLSSLSEGISNAVLEAMACGLPVVTSDCGGMREAVTDGIEGFVVPVRDPEKSAAALLKLAYSAELRWCMGEAARQRVIAQFSLGQQSAAFRRFFAAVIPSSEAAPDPL